MVQKKVHSLPLFRHPSLRKITNAKATVEVHSLLSRLSLEESTQQTPPSLHLVSTMVGRRLCRSSVGPAERPQLFYHSADYRLLAKSSPRGRERPFGPSLSHLRWHCLRTTQRVVRSDEWQGVSSPSWSRRCVRRVARPLSILPGPRPKKPGSPQRHGGRQYPHHPCSSIPLAGDHHSAVFGPCPEARDPMVSPSPKKNRSQTSSGSLSKRDCNRNASSEKRIPLTGPGMGSSFRSPHRSRQRGRMGLQRSEGRTTHAYECTPQHVPLFGRSAHPSINKCAGGLFQSPQAAVSSAPRPCQRSS